MNFRGLRHMPTIKVAMTTFPYTIDIEASIADARAMMVMHDVRHLPVVDGAALAGIVSERDLRVAEGAGRQENDAVRTACVLDTYLVEVDRLLDDVVAEMAERHIGSALVVKSGKLVGILTTSDACRLLAALLRECFPQETDGGSAA